MSTALVVLLVLAVWLLLAVAAAWAVTRFLGGPSRSGRRTLTVGGRVALGVFAACGVALAVGALELGGGLNLGPSSPPGATESGPSGDAYAPSGLAPAGLR